MGKFCRHCGKEIMEGASYCMGCGFGIEPSKEVPKVKPSEPSLGASIVGLFFGIIGFLYTIFAFNAMETGVDYIHDATEITQVLGFIFGFILVQGILTIISSAINGSVKKGDSNKVFVNITLVLNTVTICMIMFQALFLFFEY